MQKLFIIEFSTRGTSWYWAKSKEEAIQQSKTDDEATDAEIEEAEIWTIDNAINKHELIKKLDRYILKPLNRVSLQRVHDSEDPTLT
uniref:Uncharacterized protein n=1 Tax=viral metagenome TaxID=1070528 RepID=A0A6M3KAB5_9ZZZZ